ncbi:MAG: M18 family aminopeptidase [Clostridiales bacterium]|nr:M18 family aminopeptidase [Clostridiales bacterium]
MNKKLAQELIDFIQESPTAFHGTNEIKKILSTFGYVELQEGEKWNIQENGKYFLTKNNSALIAFEIGNGKIEEKGFRIIGAHTDSPGFKIKPKCQINVENHYIKLNTEVYGGPILSTWFDRPLSIAGRVLLKGKSILHPRERLINIKKPLLVIPNLAIHMNRSVNEGYSINKQKDTLPLMGYINEKLEEDNLLINIISEELKVQKDEILDFDLFLYEYEKGTILGINDEFISASRLDDLWMVHAGYKALIESIENQSTKVLICIDNEEIGSLTSQGAHSSFIKNILERICLSMGKNKEEFYRALSNSAMISADLAHALHPNVVEKHDPTNRPVLGKGPVIKIAASGSYSTDGYSAAIFKGLCENAKIPYQVFVNRSDVRGGTTIGPMMSSDLSIPVIDMGAPLIGMHSIRELGSVCDNKYTIDLFREFYNN